MAKRRAKNKQKSNRRSLLFSTKNYSILGMGILLVAIGFTAMYLENEVEGFISLFISPILIMSGYAVVIYAIMVDKNNGQESQNTQTAS